MAYQFFFVDDDPDTKEMYQIFLSNKLGPDFSFKFFVDGVDCLNYLESKCDSSDKMLIFTDINMSNMNGLTFLSNVKSGYENADVVVCSGYSTQNYKDKAEELGALDFVAKPVDLSLIVAHIESKLQKN